MGKYGIRLKWNTIACFEIDFGNTTVLTDPCIGLSPGTDRTADTVEKADLITISHVHWDHVTDLPELQKKFEAPVLVGELSAYPLAKWLDCSPSKVYPVTPGLKLPFPGVSVESIFGRHVDMNRTFSEIDERMKTRDFLKNDPALLDFQLLGSFEYRNYLFTADNGTKVLFYGNEPTEPMLSLIRPMRPDVAILQFRKIAIPEVASFAAEIGCKVLIPHHHDFHMNEEEYEPLLQELGASYRALVPDGKFISPRHGEWIEL